MDEGAEFVVGPVLDQDRLARARPLDVGGIGLLEIEEIAAFAPGAEHAAAIDQEGLAQAALDLLPVPA